MSIYDDQFNEEPQKPIKPSPTGPPLEAQFAAPPPESAPVTQGKPGHDDPEPEPPRRRFGCGSCLLAMLVIGVICIGVCGLSGYGIYSNLPEWTHNAIVAAVNDSDLDAKSKKSIKADLDRLLKEYRAGNVSGEQLTSALEEFAESPLLVLIMAYATVESYIEPSGLSDDEKAEAKLVFQRVARGTFEQDIEPEELEEAFDFISKKDFNGNRSLKNKVSDADLRSFVEECKRVADAAEVANEPYQVDVAGEVTRIVDRAMGIAPEEEVPVDDGAGPSEDDASEDDASEDDASEDGGSDAEAGTGTEAGTETDTDTEAGTDDSTAAVETASR